MTDNVLPAEAPAHAATPAAKPPPESGPTIESVHRDIGLANTYRMELIRTLLTISAALFAFTVTFGPTLKPVDWKPAMWIGWAGLAVSMIGGFIHLLGWDHYYKSYRDYDWKEAKDRAKAGRENASSKPPEVQGNQTTPTPCAAGKAARKRIDFWRRIGMYAQFFGFATGVIGVGAFAGINLDHAAAKGDSISAACCCNCSNVIQPGTGASAIVPASAPVAAVAPVAAAIAASQAASSAATQQNGATK